MTINRKYKTMCKQRAEYQLTDFELQMMLMLANNKLNTYKEARSFVYKKDIPDYFIRKDLEKLKNKFHLYMAINNYGARLRDKVGII